MFSKRIFYVVDVFSVALIELFCFDMILLYFYKVASLSNQDSQSKFELYEELEVEHHPHSLGRFVFLQMFQLHSSTISGEKKGGTDTRLTDEVYKVTFE